MNLRVYLWFTVPQCVNEALIKAPYFEHKFHEYTYTNRNVSGYKSIKWLIGRNNNFKRLPGNLTITYPSVDDGKIVDGKAINKCYST